MTGGPAGGGGVIFNLVCWPPLKTDNVLTLQPQCEPLLGHPQGWERGVLELIVNITVYF